MRLILAKWYQMIIILALLSSCLEKVQTNITNPHLVIFRNDSQFLDSETNPLKNPRWGHLPVVTGDGRFRDEIHRLLHQQIHFPPWVNYTKMIGKCKQKLKMNN